MIKNYVYTIIVVISIFVILYFSLNKNDYNFGINVEKNSIDNKSLEYEVVADNLDIPWEIVFLPNGEMLVTERSGNLVRINENKKIKIDGVKHYGEGGLLGMELHYYFEKNNFIYLYFTSEDNKKIENRVERYVIDLEKNLIKDRKVILENIPGSSYHDGGRIAFGPDNLLYITTGDAGNPDNSQNISSLAGKILRLDENGSIPNNPFGNEIYSYGHRNSQGLAWDDKGRLWATEHGRSGLQSGLDELNLIEKGKNYGWPIIQGDDKKENMINPIIHSGEKITWAPASIIFYKGNILFVGLRGETLYVYNIGNNKLKYYFEKRFGRLRAITLYNEDIYISTSNRDGRGEIRENDDRIIKIPIKTLV